MDNYKLTGAYYPPSDYERAEGKAPKMKAKPCRCEAYPFPHRLDSKACKELYDSTADEQGVWKRVDVDDWKFIPFDTRY
jgi:hypothetical protein